MKRLLLFCAVLVALGLALTACGGSPTAPSNTCFYTYSDWSVVCLNGMQSRTVATSTPSGCTGTPVTTRACPVGQ